MKKNIFLFSIVCALFTTCILSCKKSTKTDDMSGDAHQVVKEELDISIYNEIKVEGAIDVIYESKSDDGAFLEIEAEKCIIPLADIKVKGKTLHIKSKESINPGRLIVYTNSPTLKYIESKGASDVSVNGTAEGKEIKIELKGTGNIFAENLIYEKGEFKLSGSGNIKLGGQISKGKYEINGNGNIAAERLIADELDCKIKGTGNMTVNAVEKMSVEISGKGDITYSGTPQITKQKIKGSGTVRKL